MAGTAIDPYGGNRHTLSDPRDDSFGPREEPQAKRPPVVQMPPPPCQGSPFCGKPNMHLDGCDASTLEIVTLEGYTMLPFARWPKERER